MVPSSASGRATRSFRSKSEVALSSYRRNVVHTPNGEISVKPTANLKAVEITISRNGDWMTIYLNTAKADRFSLMVEELCTAIQEGDLRPDDPNESNWDDRREAAPAPTPSREERLVERRDERPNLQPRYHNNYNRRSG